MSLRTKHGVVMLVICCASLLGGCAETGDVKPTPEAAKQLLKLRGYEFDEKAFFAAVAVGDELAVNAFLAAGIDPNAKDEPAGETALISAASSGNLQIVKALLKGGADVNQKNRNGYAPLSRALTYKYDEVAETLLAQPALNLNAPCVNDMTALMTYVWRDREDIVMGLLQRGASVTLQDADGDTALHGAVQTGNVKVLPLLLARGAKVNARNKVGGTPLMWAGTYGRDEIAQVLLDRGADPGRKDDDGRTAAYWADQNRHEELGKILREAEKKTAGGRRQEAGSRRQEAGGRTVAVRAKSPRYNL